MEIKTLTGLGQLYIHSDSYQRKNIYGNVKFELGIQSSFSEVLKVYTSF